MIHSLKNTELITASDSWVLGLIAGTGKTGSEVIDNALSIMMGGELSTLATSRGVLDVVEPWIADRPQEAWAWIKCHPTDWQKFIGGWVQAGADRVGVSLIDGPLNYRKAPAESRQLLEMEKIARLASVGRIAVDDVRLQLDPGGIAAPICAALIAAQANLNPVDALNLAIEAFERQRWESISDAVMFCIQQGRQDPAIAPKIIELLRKQTTRHTLLIDASAWAEAAAFGCALEPDELRAHLTSLLPRVIDALEPVDLWMAAFPLVRASLSGGCPDILYPYITEWEMSPWEMVNLLIRYDVRSSESWELVQRCTHNKFFHSETPGWWKAAVSSGHVTELLDLIRERLLSGAAANLPCQSQMLWHI